MEYGIQKCFASLPGSQFNTLLPSSNGKNDF